MLNLLLATLLTGAAHAEPVEYALTPTANSLYVVVYADPDRWTPITAHNHAIVASDYTGTVTWDTEDLSACKVDIAFPITSLAVDPPGAREKAGLDPDGAVSDDNKETIKGNMQVKRQLYADSFPKISYSASSCKDNGGKVDVTGTLTIRGHGESITVPMTVSATPTSFSAKGQFELNHSTFGMTPFTYGIGTPKNQEKLTFVIDVTGKPK